MNRLLLFTLASILSSLLFAQFPPVQLEWLSTMGDNGRDYGYVMKLDNAENVYTLGSFNGTVDFDPGSGVHNLTSVGDTAFYIQKLDNAGNLLWVHILEGFYEEITPMMDIDALGNTYITGVFEDTVDMDPGPAVQNLVAPNYNSFLLKLDPAGNFVWAKKIDAPMGDQTSAISIDHSGNILLSGLFRSTADFDPGPAVYNLTATGTSNDIYFLKLDSSGNFIWAKSIEQGSWLNSTDVITSDKVGNIYYTGHFLNTIDFDPGSGVTNLVSNNLSTVFILSLDNTGNFRWAKSFEGSVANENNYSTDCKVDQLGNLYVIGTFNATVDFDPGPNNFLMTAIGTEDMFVVKLDSSGNFIWARSIGETGYLYPHSLEIDPKGFVFIAGFFGSHQLDFDPGLGTQRLTSNGVQDGFILKLDVSGNYIWAANIGGSFNDWIKSIQLGEDGGLYVFGSYESLVDFDPGVLVHNNTGHNIYDIFVLKLKEDFCANIALHFDSVMSDICQGKGYATAHAIHGAPPYQYSWHTTPIGIDSFAFFTDRGIYELSVTDSNNCSARSAVLINGATHKNDYDLKAHMVGTTFRAGMVSKIWIDAYNDGCVGTDGKIMLVLDSMVSYHSAPIPPDAINGDTLVWLFDSITYDSAHVVREVSLLGDTNVLFDNITQMILVITPDSTDAVPQNNYKTYEFKFRGSIDPNDKQVYPQGECDPKYLIKGEPIIYTIRFQNTGNAEAIYVYITDTISEYLDINTMQVIGNSHSLITELIDSNVVKFRFDNIELPDSITNEPESHGYVIFEIYPRPGAANGSVVENTSQIYFDYNPAVVTNTVSNTLIDSIPHTSTFREIESCESITWIDGINYTHSTDSAKYYTTNGIGCLHVVELHLTIDTIDPLVTISNDSLLANDPTATFQWLDCNENYEWISGDTSNLFIAPKSGNYAVEVSKLGCIDTSACVNYTEVGIHAHSEHPAVQVYPNPNRNGLVYVALNGIPDASINVYTVTGQTVFRAEHVDEEVFLFQLKDQQGVYLVEVSSGQFRQYFSLVRE